MRTIMRPKLLGLAVLAVLGTTACASAAGKAQPNSPTPKQTAQEANVAVNVTNNNFNDVDVYALVGGMYQRLGMVPGMDTASVMLHPYANLAGGVRLLVAPIGGVNAYLTEQIVVNPGDTVHLTVMSPLDLTNWSIT